MNRNDAKRAVHRAAYLLLCKDHENEFLVYDQHGEEFSEADQKRLSAAWESLLDDLERRGARKLP